MQGIRYTLKIWLSGLLYTPVIYILLLILLSDVHFFPALGSIISSFVIPYTFLISIWVALGIFAMILLIGDHKSIKFYLSAMGIIMSFAALIIIHHISALMSYNGSYLLAIAYATSSLIFIWLYQFNLSTTSPPVNVPKSIKNAIIYGLTVWLFTFLLSTPASVAIWIITKDFRSISSIKTALNIIERYNFQLSLSVAYFITVALITLIVINLDIVENKKKVIIFLFAFPLTFPVLFYYLLFGGEIYAYNLLEILRLILPSVIISALSIWLIDIIPGPKAKD